MYGSILSSSRITAMAPPNPSPRIIEVARVIPSNDSADSPASFSLPLTLFDIIWLVIPPVERAFFYRVTEPADSTRLYFDSVILPKLKSSLSLALHHYLPISGRLVWDPKDPAPHIVVESQNDAVLLTVAEYDADFSHLSRNEARVANELRHLVPSLQISDDSAPIISLQVTYFPNQGFCIGVTALHAVLDGRTTTAFIKAWAHICKQELERENGKYQENNVSFSLPQDLTPFFDRTVIKDPTGLGTRILNVVMSLNQEIQRKSKSLKPLPTKEVGHDMIRVTFELTREDIQKLRERVKNESPQEFSEGLHLSTFVITYAYVLTCMVKANGGDSNRALVFGFPVDYLTRLDPPVPATYFGNCIGGAFQVDANAGWFTDENAGFFAAVKAVSDMVSGLSSGPEGLEQFPEVADRLGHMQPGTQLVSIAGSNRFGVYRSDFGWGKPVKVEILSIDHNEAFSLTECRDKSGGVEIGLCLEKHKMDVFSSLFSDGLKH